MGSASGMAVKVWLQEGHCTGPPVRVSTAWRTWLQFGHRNFSMPMEIVITVFFPDVDPAGVYP
ncbi:MAG: hypothetical protein IT242_06060 [Bacteroidia bacterium]|nr:hypothetical protein [Bacteroidia bacterium]